MKLYMIFHRFGYVSNELFVLVESLWIFW